jgi:DNA end-binding protein Ku
MARAMWSGFLSFGLVNIPVGLHSATAERAIHFHQLHRGTSNRIRYKKVDEVTGEEVPAAEIVNGYDLGGGEHVVVTKEELKEVAAGRSDTIDISDFVELEQINPIHFRQSYYLSPRGKGADRAYALLRQALAETGKVGIATLVLRDKEHLVAVRSSDDVLILETMYFAEEIRSPTEEFDDLPGPGAFQGRELEVAKTLVEALATDWEPARYHDSYRQRVEELIKEKHEGREVVFEAERPKSNVIDLMAALEASIARAGASVDGGAEGSGDPGGARSTRAGGDGASRSAADPASASRASASRASGSRASGSRASGSRAAGSGASGGKSGAGSGASGGKSGAGSGAAGGKSGAGRSGRGTSGPGEPARGRRGKSAVGDASRGQGGDEGQEEAGPVRTAR